MTHHRTGKKIEIVGTSPSRIENSITNRHLRMRGYPPEYRLV